MADELTAAQRAAALRVLAEEAARREHLVVSLSGAHAYGFASGDSDADLRGVHLLPAERLFGLQQPELAADRLELIDGIEVDYTANKALVALRGVLRGNGNMIERLPDPAPLLAGPDLAALQALVRRNLSRLVQAHYAGFARRQLAACEQAEPPREKRVLYVLRTALTGTHLLLTGDVVRNLAALCDGYGLPEVHDLIAAKRATERGPLPPDLARHVPGQIQRVLAALDEALERSVLPPEPPARVELEAWLIEARRRLCGPG